jgi:hypothetical protein
VQVVLLHKIGLHRGHQLGDDGLGGNGLHPCELGPDRVVGKVRDRLLCKTPPPGISADGVPPGDGEKGVWWDITMRLVGTGMKVAWVN